MYQRIDAWNRRKGHQRLRRVARKTLHLIITFFLGVAIATIYHSIVTNSDVQRSVESICNNFGGDADECRKNIGDFLETSDGEVDNNIEINGGV